MRNHQLVQHADRLGVDVYVGCVCVGGTVTFHFCLAKIAAAWPHLLVVEQAWCPGMKAHGGRLVLPSGMEPTTARKPKWESRQWSQQF